MYLYRMFQVLAITDVECYDVSGKGKWSVIREILKALMNDQLLAEITWAGVTREGKEPNVALKSLKGVVRMILSSYNLEEYL